jgi:hypothetical protein
MGDRLWVDAIVDEWTVQTQGIFAQREMENLSDLAVAVESAGASIRQVLLAYETSLRHPPLTGDDDGISE